MKYAIAIDLGSNSLSSIKIECKTLKRVAQSTAIVRTADNLANSGKISQEATKRIIDELLRVKKQIDFSDAKLRAVTTEAMRQASNSSEVIDEIYQKSGVKFEVIDGKEEAELTVLAAKRRLEILDINRENFALIDIGGGSSELCFVYKDKIIAKSFKIGIVTLAQSSSSLDELKSKTKDFMQEVYNFAKDTIKEYGEPNLMVSTAGTPTTLAAIKIGQNYETYDGSKINGVKLKISELEPMMQNLLNLSSKAREELVGVGRGDLIVAGIVIFKNFFEILNMQESVVIDDSLREGVAYSICTMK